MIKAPSDGSGPDNWGKDKYNDDDYDDIVEEISPLLLSPLGDTVNAPARSCNDTSLGPLLSCLWDKGGQFKTIEEITVAESQLVCLNDIFALN